MGMFDSVIVNCPHCNTEIEFQSKAGSCNLDIFHPFKVPPVIANDLNGEMKKCPNCKEIMTLTCNTIPQYVEMVIN